jgi:hypothetical protein
MGNRRKFQRAIKLAHNLNNPKFIVSDNLSDEEKFMLDQCIVFLYSFHLAKKRIEKIKTMLSLADRNRDLVVLTSFFNFNEKLAKELNIEFESLCLKEKLTLFVDNPQYLEKIRQYLRDCVPKENFDDVDLTNPTEQAIDEHIDHYAIMNSVEVNPTKKVKTIFSQYF